MDLTVQIITRNNLQTIVKTIDSIKPLNPKILIADIGNDDTANICRRLGCQVYKFQEGLGHDEIRNKLTEISESELQMWMHPWECLVQGHSNVPSFECKKVNIVQESIVQQETRIWLKSSNSKFLNPIYETLDEDAKIFPICFYSTGNNDYEYNLNMVKQWKNKNPTLPQPCYYHALTLFALKKYDSFINASEHYMFMEKRSTKSAILNRYYYAIAQVIHKKNFRPALQNLNICLSQQPLMAEFWCLIGDIHYHLLNKFTTAKEFYENAIILGGRRLSNDGWPMDVSKYNDYPATMISSCQQILGKKSIFHSF